MIVRSASEAELFELVGKWESVKDARSKTGAMQKLISAPSLSVQVAQIASFCGFLPRDSQTILIFAQTVFSKVPAGTYNVLIRCCFCGPLRSLTPFTLYVLLAISLQFVFCLFFFLMFLNPV